MLIGFVYVAAGPILSTADIFQEEQYRQRNMFQVATPPEGNCLVSADTGLHKCISHVHKQHIYANVHRQYVHTDMVTYLKHTAHVCTCLTAAVTIATTLKALVEVCLLCAHISSLHSCIMLI